MIVSCRQCGAPFDKRNMATCCLLCRPVARADTLRTYAETHRRLVRATKSRWRLANPEKQAAARRRWHLANLEREREHRRATKRRHPEANRSYVRSRTARQRGATVIPFAPGQLRDRLSMYGGRCWICGGPGTTIDHVKPLARGGYHVLANLRPACSPCNSRKGDQWPLSA